MNTRAARGIGLLELGVALGIFMLALGLGLAAVASSVGQRAAQDRRDAARETVRLGLERARALPAGTLRAGLKKKAIGLPEALAPRLPGGSCTLEIAPDPSDASLALVRLEVTWKAPGGNASEQGEALLRVPAEAGVR